MTNQIKAIKKQPTDLESALQIIEQQEAEIQKLKDSEVALSDANIRVAELYMDLEDSQNQVLEQQEEIQRQNEELEANLEHLRDVNKMVKKSHQNTLNSINYARRIQDSLLPDIGKVAKWYKQFFVYYQPKDIVGGDFYWCVENKWVRVLVTADCTGHGVPGAFMTFIGHNLLSKIVQDKKIYNPAKILEALDKELCQTLKQNGKDDCRDSIELSVMVDYIDTNFIEIASARSTFLCFRKGKEPEIFKGGKSPVGDAYFKKKEYNAITFNKEEGMRFYFYSDGFVDQFGGEDNRKYGRKRLVNFLSSIQENSVSDQLPLLKEELENWKGTHAQIDDILVMGIQI